MRILISGGGGFIGSNLVHYLSNMNYELTVLDNLSVGTKENLLDAGYQSSESNLIVADIKDKQLIIDSLQGMHAVIHLAAQTSVIDSIENPQRSWDVNVTGTLNLLEGCRINRVKTFIFASSNAVLGEQPPPANESQVPKPLSPYGSSKLAGEALCSAYYQSYGIKTVSLRFANCYGSFSKHKTSVINKFIHQFIHDRPITIYGDGKQTRDFIHANDICSAIHLCLSNPDKIAGEVFQIGSGIETSINQLTELLIQIIKTNASTSHYKLERNYQPKRKGEIIRNYSDISKVKDILDFQVQIKLQDGLYDLWRWYTQSNQ